MIKDVLSFFSDIQRATWQEIVLTVVLIPTVFELYKLLNKWLRHRRPLNLLLKGFRDERKEILIFLAQLFSVKDNGERDPRSIFKAAYPQPYPGKSDNITFKCFSNIDLVWTQTDGECATDIFNILGRAGRRKNFRIADVIKDWSRTEPTFSIGFNPKTDRLLENCRPINFSGQQNGMLTIDGTDIKLHANYPNDAGIVQKTFVRNTSIPVFILAGLGTTGTSAAGYVLNSYGQDLGRLYGCTAFCLLFHSDITRGREYHQLKAVYPKPHFIKAFSSPFTYLKWYRKGLF